MAQNRAAGRLVERLESQLKFFELDRAVRDSMSVRLLTTLAAVLIPMSLACEILSMQSRFADLHYLIYDFCGVITIIASLATTIFLSLKVFMGLVDVWAKYKARPLRIQRIREVVYWLLLLEFLF